MSSTINYLKLLELHGFKSFAPKTVLEFPARVTAVVGPNGSGKSNVIDALRWVLGEREVKNLRGATLDNLIFAGTPKRAASGFARVGLWFDNRERLFEADAEEVVVARKIDRSGVSEFSMNDAEMRLRDLIPMLARARLGARGLNMIGQGQSDVFVKSSPQDRREMIEEILGLREFRLKKTQAERRLTASEINMDKVQAMLDELSPHLRLLRRQKHRWDKRADVERELTELENTYFSFRYHALDHGLHSVAVPLEVLTKERNEKEKSVQGLEQNLRKIDEQGLGTETAKTIREELAKMLDRRSGSEKTLARLEAKIEFEMSRPTQAADHTLAESLELVRGTLVDLRSALASDSLDVVKGALAPVILKLETFLAAEKPSVDQSLADEVEKLKQELESLDREIKKLRAAEEEEAKKREELNRAFRDQIEHMDREKNELRRLDREIQEKLLEKERLQLQLNEVFHEWHTLGRTVEELKVLPEPVASTEGGETGLPAGLPAVARLQGDAEAGALAEAERRIMRLRGEIIAIGEIDEAIVKEATESEARFEFLSHELEDLKKATTDLRKLIKGLEMKIHEDFKSAFRSINNEFNTYFKLMFGGGRAHLKLVVPKPKVHEPESEAEGVSSVSGGQPGKNHLLTSDVNRLPETAKEETLPEEQEDPELSAGIEINLNLPRKRITSLDMLSGGEKSLVSIAALFALIAVSPPPFLVLDEIDAPLDDENARRFAELVKNFSSKTQFIIVTHNRATMEAADVLYGITMGDDGVSKVLSLKLE